MLPAGRRQARKMGLDLDNPRVRAEFEAWAMARRKADLADKAKELGLELSDPGVQRIIGEMQAEAAAGRDPRNALRRRWTWRRVVVELCSPKRLVNLQNCMYVFILGRFAWRTYHNWVRVLSNEAAAAAAAGSGEPDLWME